MYLNHVTLTGYLGGDAESRTTRSNATFVVFSIATKKSWKDRESGEWTSRTDWHRAIVFGPLTQLAGELIKGDHVQIQGQLQTREYEKRAEGENRAAVKQRVTEIRVTSIVKLDRSKTPQGAAA